MRHRFISATSLSCRGQNALDFDDLLLETVALFQREPLVLEHYQQRFQYVMVDEYQDTNRAQYALVHQIAEASRTCAWSATTTSPFTAGGERISTTSWSSKKIIRKPVSSNWNRITGRHNVSWLWPTR